MLNKIRHTKPRLRRITEPFWRRWVNRLFISITKLSVEHSGRSNAGPSDEMKRPDTPKIDAVKSWYGIEGNVVGE